MTKFFELKLDEIKAVSGGADIAMATPVKQTYVSATTTSSLANYSLANYSTSISLASLPKLPVR